MEFHHVSVLLNECIENGDKILDACKVEDRYEFKDGKFESKYQRMYEYAVIKAIKDKHKELGNKLRKVINERIDIEEKLADTNMPYQKYMHLLREKEDIEKKEEKLSQRKQIVRDMLDVCYEAVWGCDDHKIKWNFDRKEEEINGRKLYAKNWWSR